MKGLSKTFQHYFSHTVSNRSALVSVAFLNNECFMTQYLGINPKNKSIRQGKSRINNDWKNNYC